MLYINDIKILDKDEYNPGYWEIEKFNDKKVKCRHYCSMTWKEK